MHERGYSLTRTVWMLVLLVAMASGMSRAAAAPAPDSKRPIRIGVVVPLAGPLAPLARDIVDGARLYVDEVSGELVGRKVELNVEDYEFKSAFCCAASSKRRRETEASGRLCCIGSSSSRSNG